MNRNVELAVFAVTASIFGAIFLVGLLVLGGPGARIGALLAALMACGSQFAGGNASTSLPSYKASIALAYSAFCAALIALGAFVAGL